jgi:hypothetical protein
LSNRQAEETFNKGEREMRYIQYFERGIVTGKLIESCGSDGVSKLDGRYRISRCIEEAVSRNFKKRPAFKIMEGETFSRSSPVTDIITVKDAMNLI